MDPEIGRAEVVIMDAESYQKIVERLDNMNTIAGIWDIFSLAGSDTRDRISDTKMERRARVMDELTAETQRLDLYNDRCVTRCLCALPAVTSESTNASCFSGLEHDSFCAYMVDSCA